MIMKNSINTKINSKLVILSLMVIMGIFSLSFNHAFAIENYNSLYTSSILDTTNIGFHKFLVTFNVCAKEKRIVDPIVLLKSDTETQTKYFKNVVMPPYTCKTFTSSINSKYADRISVELTKESFT